MKNLFAIALIFSVLNSLSAQDIIELKTAVCQEVATELDEPARIQYFMCEKSEDFEKKDNCAKKHLKNKLERAIKYPKVAISNETGGTLKISLLIDQNGDLAKIRIDQALGDGYEEAVTDALKTIDDFLPAEINGVSQCAWIENIELELSTVKIENGVKTYGAVEEMPRFSGCEDIEDVAERKTCAEKEMLMHIYKNISYPSIARENGVEGTVVVRFIIDEKGNIVEPKVLRDIGAQCGPAAVAAIMTMPAWISGKQHGEAVRVSYNMPIRFRLENGGRKKGKKKKKKRRRWN